MAVASPDVKVKKRKATIPVKAPKTKKKRTEEVGSEGVSSDEDQGNVYNSVCVGISNLLCR